MSAPLYDKVDRSETDMQSRAIQMLDAQNRYRSNQAIKREMVELLNVQPGDGVLDIGSGTGDDTRQLARLVGSDGTVAGIDASEVMVAEARRRADQDGVPVTFQVSDAQNLPFPGESFDCVWSERTFLWLEDPTLALSEAIRVTKPGGRIVISTYDIGTGAVGGFEPELDARIQHLNGVEFPSPRIGRALPAMFHREGLCNITVRVQLVEHEVTDTNPPIRWVARTRMETAIRAGVLAREEADRYLCSLDDAIAAGVVFSVCIAFVVAGTKPE